jgi:hypothetical protein
VTKWQWQLQKSMPKLGGVQKICQSEFSSDSIFIKMLKQVQHDKNADFSINLSVLSI